MVNPCLITGDSSSQKVLAVNGMLLQECRAYSTLSVGLGTRSHFVKSQLQKLVWTLFHEADSSRASVRSQSLVLFANIALLMDILYAAVPVVVILSLRATSLVCHSAGSKFCTPICRTLSTHQIGSADFHQPAMNFLNWHLIHFQKYTNLKVFYLLFPRLLKLLCCYIFATSLDLSPLTNKYPQDGAA